MVGVTPEVAREIAEAAHQICPYDDGSVAVVSSHTIASKQIGYHQCLN